MPINGLKIVNSDELKASIDRVKFVKRRSTGVIPYGYRPARFNRGLLEVIPDQLFALHVALAKLHEGVPLRSVAKWLSIVGKRHISHTSLRRYFLQDQQKLLERVNILEDKAREIFEEVGPKNLTNGPIKARRNKQNVSKRKRGSEKAEHSDTETGQTSQQQV